MRAMAFLFIVCFSDAPAFQLRSLHFEPTEELKESPGKNAVGLFVYAQNKTHWVIQSGFFFRPDLFITAFNPSSRELPDVKQLRIHTGIEDISVSEIRARETHEVVSVPMQNSRYGFIILRTKGKNSAHIPLPTEDESKGWATASKIYMAGYSRRGEYLISHDCRPKIGACLICDKEKKDKLVSAAWGQSDCLYKKGMMGSPLFYIADGKWLPFGFMGSYVAAAGKGAGAEIGEQISLVRLLALQNDFGEKLDGEFKKE